MVISRLVLKLGLVRFATSLLVVLLANVLNRVLIVDLTVPAALVTFSFAFQHVMTPVGLVTGYFSDNYAVRGRRRAPYIWGGMLLSVAVMPFFPGWALDLGAQPHSSALLYQGVLLFSLFGIGTTVSATAINALLVDRMPERDRGGALTMVWILTLLGFIVGSALAGVLFPAFDPGKIHQLFAAVTLVVVAVTIWGAWGIEGSNETEAAPGHGQMALWPTLKFLASNRQALAFFVFLGTTIFFLTLRNLRRQTQGRQTPGPLQSRGDINGLPIPFGVRPEVGEVVKHRVQPDPHQGQGLVGRPGDPALAQFLLHSLQLSLPGLEGRKTTGYHLPEAGSGFPVNQPLPQFGHGRSQPFQGLLDHHHLGLSLSIDPFQILQPEIKIFGFGALQSRGHHAQGP